MFAQPSFSICRNKFRRLVISLGIFISFSSVLISIKSIIPNFSQAETPQIFLNFRGEDVRYNFVSHLIDAFERHAINYFIDVHEQRGKDLNHLFDRIEESSIAIALLSPRFYIFKIFWRASHTLKY